MFQQLVLVFGQLRVRIAQQETDKGGSEVYTETVISKLRYLVCLFPGLHGWKIPCFITCLLVTWRFIFALIFKGLFASVHVTSL